MATGPRQRHLRLGAGGEDRLHPTRLFLHGVLPCRFVRALETICPCFAAGFWRDTAEIKVNLCSPRPNCGAKGGLQPDHREKAAIVGLTRMGGAAIGEESRGV